MNLSSRGFIVEIEREDKNIEKDFRPLQKYFIKKKQNPDMSVFFIA